MKILSSLVVALAMIVAGLGPAAAQSGSYQQSCVHIRNHGNSLSASCTAPNGQRIHSTVALPCYGDIANNNGYLRCDGRGGGGYPGNRPGFGHGPSYGGGGFAPQGSYRQSCRGINVRGNFMTAECTATNGQWIRSSLDYARCRYGTDVANVNGRLTCLSYR